MSGLQGKIIITTCAQEKAEKLEKLLTAKNAHVINYPMIKIEAADTNSDKIKDALQSIESYHWIVFSSTNGVKYFFYWLNKFNIKLNPNALKFATIGTATLDALKQHGFSSDFTGNGNDSKEFASELLNIIEADGQTILTPVGNLAMQNIAQTLCAKHTVYQMVVYTTNENHTRQEALIKQIADHSYHAAIFLSPSAGRSFSNSLANASLMQQVKSIPIGRTTEKELLSFGNKPMFIPSKPDLNTLVDELDNYYKEHKS